MSLVWREPGLEVRAAAVNSGADNIDLYSGVEMEGPDWVLEICER